jgi:hypothetical protein
VIGVKQATSIGPLQVRRGAFSLIELLVVVALLVLTLAILFPALRKARGLAKRVVCQRRLAQIAIGYTAYLDDHDGRFYTDDPNVRNPNYTFGGWMGRYYRERFRPVNPYLGLPAMDAAERDATLFRCPTDKVQDLNRAIFGSIYADMGNSYQANGMLVLPHYLPIVKEPWAAINVKIRACGRARRDNVFQSSRMLWFGDSSWYTQWDPLADRCTGRHGRRHYHCVAFLDGHVAFVEIIRGLYDVDGGYRIQPHRAADETIRANQRRVPCSCESP